MLGNAVIDSVALDNGALAIALHTATESGKMGAVKVYTIRASPVLAAQYIGELLDPDGSLNACPSLAFSGATLAAAFGTSLTLAEVQGL